MRSKMKVFLFGLVLSLLSAFTAVEVKAQPPCGKVWINGHYNRHGDWIRPHWRHMHRVPGHYNRYGNWIPGHCK